MNDKIIPNNIKILLNIRNFNQTRSNYNENNMYYRSNNTFVNIHSNYVMIDPLVKITNYNITSSTAFVESSRFKKLIDTMKEQSNTYNEVIYYNKNLGLTATAPATATATATATAPTIETIIYNKSNDTIIVNPNSFQSPLIY